MSERDDGVFEFNDYLDALNEESDKFYESDAYGVQTSLQINSLKKPRSQAPN